MRGGGQSQHWRVGYFIQSRMGDYPHQDWVGVRRSTTGWGCPPPPPPSGMNGTWTGYAAGGAPLMDSRRTFLSCSMIMFSSRIRKSFVSWFVGNVYCLMTVHVFVYKHETIRFPVCCFDVVKSKNFAKALFCLE